MIYENTRVQSFPPVLFPSSKVLILGSMPGQRSLAETQYYAHPQNAFWSIISAYADLELADYEQKLSAIASLGLGLWDVLQQCEREGSLDSAIKGYSEVANDFVWLERSYPEVQTLLFNGKKAEQAFRKHVIASGAVEMGRFNLVGLPSTSPANAAISKVKKLNAWHSALCKFL